MYKVHPNFKTPENTDIVIWRYLSFTKFLSLIVEKSLFFSSVATLRQIDSFEGTLPSGNKQLRTTSNNNPYEAFDNISESTISSLIFVNCWHMSNVESMAMWKLYLPSGEGVAIRSSFKRLSECFKMPTDIPRGIKGNPIEIFIGEIAYVDYLQATIPDGNLFYRCLHKDLSFAYEQELRAVVMLESAPNSMDGIYFPVDLKTLIESVVLPPNCSAWIKKLTLTLMRQYSLNVPIDLSRFQKR